MAMIKFSMVKSLWSSVCIYNLLFRPSLTPFTNMHSPVHALMVELLNSLSKKLLKQLLGALWKPTVPAAISSLMRTAA